MAFKEAVPDVLDADSRPEVAFSFGTILQRYGDFSISTIREYWLFRLFTLEMSISSLLFVRFGARMQCATSKLADAVDTDCHRESCIIRIGKNGPFLKSVPFPLNDGKSVKCRKSSFLRMSDVRRLVSMERGFWTKSARFWHLWCMQWRWRRRSACFMNDSGAVACDERLLDRLL